MKSKSRLIFFVFLFFVISSEICHANPIVFPVHSFEGSSILFALLVDSGVDLFVVFLALWLMRELRGTDGLSFFYYMLYMVFGGFLIDAVSMVFSSMSGFANGSSFVSGGVDSLGVLAISAFLLLAIYNLMLSNRFLDISKYQRVFLAFCVGVFTNPAIYFLFKG